jgi:hypothetical protein
MNVSLLFLCGLMVTAAMSFGVVAYLQRPLRKLLVELCGNDPGAVLDGIFQHYCGICSAGRGIAIPAVACRNFSSIDRNWRTTEMGTGRISDLAVGSWQDPDEVYSARHNFPNSENKFATSKLVEGYVMKRGWSRNSAMVGALAWTAMCAYAGAGNAPLGVIELLVLFAVLVIVPLGLSLGDAIAPGPHRLMHLLEIFQPLAAASLAASFWIAPGPYAAALALPWAVVCVAVALIGLLSMRSVRSWQTLAVNVGRMDLAVAAVWLLASRFGLRPLGIQEPIVLLTAVHFHYTGFISAAILGAALKASNGSRVAQPLQWFGALVLFVPFVVATGFVFSPFLRMAGGIAMAVSMAGFAVIQIVLAGSATSRVSRAYLYVSSMSVAAGMAIAAIYAVSEWLHRDWVVIPQVAQTHGVLNALGFSLCGVLGWLIECAPTSQSVYFGVDKHAVGMK